MRWYQTSEVARPAYYDRQAITILPGFASNVGPHGSTIRAQYLPPTNYAAFIESTYLSIIRITAAAPIGLDYVQAIFDPFQAIASQFALMSSNNNTPYNNDQFFITSFGYMAFGDMLELRSAAGDTGGTAIYTGAAKLCEFVY